jgi:hypothetical protein
MRYLREADRYLREAGVWPTTSREWRRAVTLTVIWVWVLMMPGLIDHLITWAGI